MMSAELEVQDYVNANCPIFGPSHDCFNDYTLTRSGENPIYMEIHSFETTNFFILSIDTAPDANNQNTLEYYYRQERVLEKYTSPIFYTYDGSGNILGAHYGSSYYFRNLSKLYIYQSEIGYEIDPFFTDFEELAKSSHHRILYSGAKSADEDSLLLVDQKGTIKIAPVSFDPSYAQVIMYYFEDEAGVRYAYGTYIYDCHEGDACAMQYTPYDSYPFLVSDPTYSQMSNLGSRTANEENREEPVPDNPVIDADSTSDNIEITTAPEGITSDSANEATDNTNVVATANNANEIAATENPKIAAELKTVPSLPNTGSASRETDIEPEIKGKIEFPWWLGIIIFLGIITLIWFFLPDFSKKTQKKGLTKFKK